MAVETVFRALADPNRIKMVMLLGEKACTVNQLKTSVGISQSSASQHLKILLEAKLVSCSKLGNFRVYSLRSEELKRAMGYFDKLWDEGLQTLKTTLESRK